jgi:hypothetical protein
VDGRDLRRVGVSQSGPAPLKAGKRNLNATIAAENAAVAFLAGKNKSAG